MSGLPTTSGGQFSFMIQFVKKYLKLSIHIISIQPSLFIVSVHISSDIQTINSSSYLIRTSCLIFRFFLIFFQKTRAGYLMEN